jgi:hypothetical protein
MKILLSEAVKLHLIRILLILVIIGLAACSGSKTEPDRSGGEEPLNEHRALIEKNISDENKKSQMLKVVDDLQIEVEEFYTYYEKHKANLLSLHSSYDTKPAQFEDNYNEFLPKYKKFLTAIVSKRTELQDLATEEEWKEISKITKTFVPPKDFQEN